MKKAYTLMYILLAVGFITLAYEVFINGKITGISLLPFGSTILYCLGLLCIDDKPVPKKDCPKLAISIELRGTGWKVIAPKKRNEQNRLFEEEA